MHISIEKISRNKDGILCVTPRDYTFDAIYRSAMGVHWNQHEGFLYHNPSVEWDILRWYRQIVSAVENEYGGLLIVCQKPFMKTSMKHL